jgi:small subunit ribosomal protein S21
MKVICQEGKFEQNFRKFKKKIADDGFLFQLREREFYMKPSIARKLAKNKAVSRWKKYLNSQELPKKQF